jgi:hypothetical protein
MFQCPRVVALPVGGLALGPVVTVDPVPLPPKRLGLLVSTDGAVVVVEGSLLPPPTCLGAGPDVFLFVSLSSIPVTHLPPEHV